MILKKIELIIRAFRIPEVIMMSGFFLIGGFFAIDTVGINEIYKILALGILSVFIVFAVYSFNAYAGIDDDKYNLRLQSLFSVSPKFFISSFFTASFFVIAISLFLNPFTIVFSIIILILWTFYSHPKYGLKQKAIYGTLIHFVAQTFHFILAWMVFKDISLNAILLAIYFSIAFSCGHLLHEIIDYNADNSSGFKTTPIKFGIKTSTYAITTLLGFNMVYLYLLFYLKILDYETFLSFFAASAAHFILIISSFKNIKENAIKIRKYYRLLYFFAGLIFFLKKINYG